MNRLPAKDCLDLRLKRVRKVAPSLGSCGDSIWPVLLAVVLGGFVFYPLVRDVWPWVLMVLLLAALAFVSFCCLALLTKSRDRDLP
jgi:hypothetical protein